MDKTMIIRHSPVSKAPVSKAPEGHRWSAIHQKFIPIERPPTKLEEATSELNKFLLKFAIVMVIFVLLGGLIQKSIAFEPETYNQFIQSIPRNVDRCEYLNFVLKSESGMSYQRALARKAFKEQCSPTK